MDNQNKQPEQSQQRKLPHFYNGILLILGGIAVIVGGIGFLELRIFYPYLPVIYWLAGAIAMGIGLRRIREFFQILDQIHEYEQILETAKSKEDEKVLHS